MRGFKTQKIHQGAEGRESFSALERYCTCKRYISKSMADVAAILEEPAMLLDM